MTEAAAPPPRGATIIDGGAPAIPLVGDRYRRYALVILMLVYTLSFLDRQIVSILAEPIKNDLKVADWQIGLMSGLAFAVFYTVLGIPIARAADRYNRVWIIGASLTAWSGFTALCGAAQNFWQLVAARIGVGIGEAGCTPTSHALIADYVPKEKRASALAFFSIGTPLGSIIGLGMGGLIADAYGWRTAFLVAGVPGLIFAVIVFFTLKEPRKQLARDAAARAPQKGQFKATVAFLMHKPTFWLIAFAAAIKAFIGYGQAPFIASFFFRAHGPEVVQLAASFGLKPAGFIGLALGLLAGTAGIVSSWLGGVLADRAVKRGDLRGYMSVPAIASVLSIPISCTAYVVDSAPLALVLLIGPGLLGALWYGPVYSTGQGLVPPHMRATAASLLLFIINMVGLGFGPLAVGALSDVFAKGLGLGSAEGVRWALVASSFLGVIAALLFWLARFRIREEMES